MVLTILMIVYRNVIAMLLPLATIGGVSGRGTAGSWQRWVWSAFRSDRRRSS